MERPKLYHPSKLEIARHFLPKLLLGSLSAFSAAQINAQQDLLSSFVSEVSGFELQAGPRLLTRAEALEHVERSTRLIVTALDPNIAPEHFIKRIYIYRGDREFREDYPLFDLTEELARYLSFLNRNFAGSQNSSYGSMIYINKVNIRPTAMPMFKGQFGQDLECTNYQPAVGIRSATAHEVIHDLLMHEDYYEVEDSILEAIIANFEKEWGKSLRGDDYNITARMNGFLVNLEVEKETEDGKAIKIVRRYTWFGEFIDDYIKDRKFMELGLSYKSAYPNPVDTANFSLILDKAGISQKELFKWAREGEYSPFFQRVGLSAEGDFESLQDRINTMYRLFVGVNGRLPWPLLKQYFPEISLDRLAVIFDGQTCQISFVRD